MTQKLSYILALGITLGAANQAVADEMPLHKTGIYGGVNYNYTQLEYAPEIKGVFEKNLHGVNPYVGYDVNDYLAVEMGAFLTTTGDKTIMDGQLSTDIALSGAYADVVGKIPVSNNCDVLGSVGYVRTNVQAGARLNGTSESITDEGAADGYRVGLGVQHDVYNGMFVRAMGYYVDPGFEGIENAKVASVGLGYKF